MAGARPGTPAGSRGHLACVRGKMGIKIQGIGVAISRPLKCGEMLPCMSALLLHSSLIPLGLKALPFFMTRSTCKVNPQINVLGGRRNDCTCPIKSKCSSAP